MLVAAFDAQAILGLVAVLVLWIAPFFVARRIGLRKGRRWFWYALFLGWIGVLILAALGPTRFAESSSTYHVPPEVARRQAAQRKR
jgi:hypothetical protein